MVAFVTSILVALLMTAVIFAYMKRRPVGTPLTWGEAMFASVYVFFLLFWAYGVVPHQWLSLADNEWNWRADRLVSGPGGIVEKLPIDISYLIIRDLIAVGIYGVLLAANVAIWMMWQNRGQKKTPEIETSRFGRPLVRGA
ncbi:MAG: hypothetical protein JJE52_16310 [Acidimicrobiia bacterium]|nr:hypothetical protein [Acidimicrobiia bacterium]